jgi:fibronectin type 3 domain-containing protein
MFPKARFISALALALIGLNSGILSAQTAERVIAYAVPADTEGNQAFGGTLGMNFEVANPILVTQIGVFDDMSDGLNLPITAKIWDRSNPDAPEALVTVEFTPEEPGVLVGGSRFKALPTPLRLEVGFLGTIAAEGYGEGERLRNAGAVPKNWTLNDGNGSLVFVGTSSYGTENGAYPNVPDGGPADRYAAGTFEFETTPPLKPGVPTGVTVEPGDGRVTLTWAAVTTPLPAAKYEIWRATSPTAEFTKAGETTTPDYTDTAVTNGSLYCYKIRGMGATGQEGVETARLCASPYVLPDGQLVAYQVNAAIAGTQAFEGTLGMDFEIANPILVTHLGVFDDGSDGLARPITARLWDRSNPDAPTEVASLEFTTEDPGVLIRGTRFKALPSPVRLEVGFKGTISGENYGAEERLVNPGGSLTVARPWSVISGSGSVQFVGTGRYSANPGEYPTTPDSGAPDRYGSGSFQFQTTALVNPGVPKVSAALGELSIELAWPAINEPAAAAKYRIFRRAGEGVASQVAEVADLTYSDTGLTKGTLYCYTVAAVTAAGQASAPSAERCLSAEAREAGVAYLVEAGTVGNQAFGGGLGMDFNVVRSIRVTRLGVFDDSSDGIFLPITARLYDRSTRSVLAELVFTAEDFGELIGGSRFKDLAQPIVLASGFQGTMAASGYGGDERNGNGVDGRSLFSAGGSLEFVGLSAYAVDPAAYPGTVDAGPANRYAAGTFYFEPAAEAPRVGIARSGSQVVIQWTGAGVLQSSPAVSGPWTAVAGAVSGVQVPTSGAAAFYRVQQ